MVRTSWWESLFNGCQAARFGMRGLFAPAVLGVQAIALDEAGRVLLVEHSYRAGWCLPGGGIGRREAPGEAIMRELREEIGLISGDPPELFGLYLNRIAWADNPIAVYVVRNVAYRFAPSFEIRRVLAAAPAVLPDALSAGAARRLDEFFAGADRATRW